MGEARRSGGAAADELPAFPPTHFPLPRLCVRYTCAALPQPPLLVLALSKSKKVKNKKVKSILSLEQKVKKCSQHYTFHRGHDQTNEYINVRKRWFTCDILTFPRKHKENVNKILKSKKSKKVWPAGQE